MDKAKHAGMTFEQTRRNQADAADPSASAWVSANAGTGKTHVLTMRVLRLLLAGTPPERILCLTYTKAAAAEMSKRVFDRLAKWVTIETVALRSALADLLEHPASEDEIARARQLFALAIETPGGLKVQTIHSFCERLLQRFPLEAGVPPHFAILDEETARQLERQAVDDVLMLATQNAQSSEAKALAKALSTAIAYATDDSFDAILHDALRKRDWLEFTARRSLAAGDDLAAAEGDYRRLLGITPGVTRASLEAALSAALSDDMCRAIHATLLTGSKADNNAAAKIADITAASSPAARMAALEAAFLTAEGTPRKALMTKGLQAKHPDVLGQMTQAQDKILSLSGDLKKLKLLEATLALLRLAGAVMQRYSDAKARRAALDFDDLLTRTANLLGKTESAEWVLFKLDGGLDHILVDEAQDTSPVQWSVIQALAAEFFAGSGARDHTRTLFAVGDEKQSIYSFQGAAPKMFAASGNRFAEMARQAGLTWRRIPLTLSFRTVAPVLACVDQVFADAARTPGLSSSADAISHKANRAGQAGLVEIWPTEIPDEVEAGATWSPLSGDTTATPVARLAGRIAATIDGWLRSGEMLASENRPIRAGDIIVLLRKRRPFADAMVKALKSRGIAVAGADRLRLTEQIAVQDLMALGDFLALPEDDLSLAVVLKSPLFGLDDDDLLQLATCGKSQLWSALLDRAKHNPRFEEAASQLKLWRTRADYAPPYEFFAALLDRDNGRARLLARLGPEAADPIDEFLNLALTYDDGAPPSMQGFLDWLRRSTREIKRDMEHGRDEVRIMTVHGAKGLEAPIVFLPDTCSARSGAGPGGLIDFEAAEGPAGIAAPAPVVWPVKGTSKLDVVQDAKLLRAAAETEERNRLLYVAMTRARDRLYIGGFEGRLGRDKDCWYDLMVGALADTATKETAGDGSTVWRHVAEQTAEHEEHSGEIADALQPVKKPDWALRPAPHEPTLAVPLAPSRLAPLETDDEGEPLEVERDNSEQPVMAPRKLADGNRFLRGTLSHALLEHLPSFAPGTRKSAAEAFVANRGAGLPAATQASIVSEVLAVLAAPEFAMLFGSGSRAEVPIAASIAPPNGKGPPLRITGQIDRMAITGEDILIVDYKTNRPPPHDVDKVAQAYLLQLAAYRLAVGEVFPGRRVRAAILWTDGVRIMEIPEEILDQHQQQLWSLGGPAA